MIKVMIAEDHQLVRQAIRALLEKAGGIEVIGEAADGQEILELVTQLVPDVVIMDIAMPRLNGTQAIKKIRSMNLPTQVVVLSMYSEETLVREALRSGAKGYLLKTSAAEELLLAIKSAVNNGLYLSPTISGSLVDSIILQDKEDTSADSLTPREMEVLKLIAESNTNPAIAKELNISIKTVEKHRANIMMKLKAHDTVSLVRTAIRKNLIFLE